MSTVPAAHSVENLSTGELIEEIGRLRAELKKAEFRLADAQRIARLGYWEADLRTKRDWWSGEYYRMLGMSPGQVEATYERFVQLVHPEDRDAIHRARTECLARRGPCEVTYRIVLPDAARRFFHTRAEVEFDANGNPVRVFEACRIAVEAGKFPLAWIGMVDRDAMRIRPLAWHGREQGLLGLLQGRFSLRENGPEGLGVAAIAVIENRAVIANDVTNDPRFASIRKELLERGILSVAIFPLSVSGEVQAVLALSTAETEFFDDEEMKLLQELVGDIAFALDHLEKEKRLDYLAYYDALTGLANRALFHERLEQHAHAAGREQRKLALLLIDLERFKTVNDTLGRNAGDQLLKQIAERMRQHAADSDLLARVGRDQFALVIPEAGIDNAVARRLEEQYREWFGEPFPVNEAELRIAAKVGIAVYPDDGADAEALFRNAEAALKMAKAGGERYVFYARQMNERVAEKLALENKLRRALEREEFALHYQPVVEAETRRIAGVEALLRWMSPELGLVAPLTFIPLIEETGLILEVGAWALHQAVRDRRHWLEQGVSAPRVAVNVSPIQLRRGDFVALVEQALEQGAAPAGIDLEITESLIMEDIEASVEKLKALRALGVNLAVDDFGTGYSSLGYLARLPIETLKIDRSFIITMSSDPNAMTLVSTIITLAHSLDLKVTAEGVETEEQAKILRLLRCDRMQGYLFSRPLPREQLADLLRQGGLRIAASS